MENDSKKLPMSLRDPALPTNQTVPLSMRTSGQELDECCSAPGGGIQQASAGLGLDHALKQLKKK
jgi:hypothetical protein